MSPATQKTNLKNLMMTISTKSATIKEKHTLKAAFQNRSVDRIPKTCNVIVVETRTTSPRNVKLQRTKFALTVESKDI